MDKHIKTTKGFTMAELIIVMGILAILFTLSVNTYKAQRDQTSFNNSLIDILSVIKTARDYASTSKAAGNTGTVPVNGYGVYIVKDVPGKSKLILFANTGSDADKYDNDGEAPDDYIEKEYIIPAKTLFGAFTGDSANIGTNKAAIIFKPLLEGVVITNNTAPTVTEFTDLSMQFSREGAPTAYKTIKINRIAGFPEIEL